MIRTQIGAARPAAKRPPSSLSFTPFHDYRWSRLTETVMRGNPMRLRAGQYLFLTGDTIDAIYYVERGELQVSLVSASGQSKIIQVMPPGTTFGELQLYARVTECPVTVMASRNTLLRVTPYATLWTMAERDPELATNLMASMSHKALSFLKQIEDLTFRSVRQRVACLLQAMFSAAQGNGVSLGIAQETIAALVGAHRVTVTNVLQEFQEEGAIVVARERIVLLDKTKLGEAVLRTSR